MNRKSLSILKLSVRESSELTKKRVSFNKIKKVRHIENNTKNDFMPDLGSDKELSLTSEESFNCILNDKSNVDKLEKPGSRRKISILNLTVDEIQSQPSEIVNDENDNSFQLSHRVGDGEENYVPQRKSTRLNKSLIEIPLNQSFYAADNEQEGDSLDLINHDLNETFHGFDNETEEIPYDHESLCDHRNSDENDFDCLMNIKNLSFEKYLDESKREDCLPPSLRNIEANNPEASKKTISNLSTSYKENNKSTMSPCDDLNSFLLPSKSKDGSYQFLVGNSPGSSHIGCNDANIKSGLDFSSSILDSRSIEKSVSNFDLNINIDDRAFESNSRSSIDGGILIENDPIDVNSCTPIDNDHQELINNYTAFNEISPIAKCTQTMHSSLVSPNDTFRELENIDPNIESRQNYCLINEISPIARCASNVSFDSSFSGSEHNDSIEESGNDLNMVIHESNKIVQNSGNIDSENLLDSSVFELKDFDKDKLKTEIKEVSSGNFVATPIQINRLGARSSILILTPSISSNNEHNTNHSFVINDKITSPDQLNIKNPFDGLDLSQCKSNIGFLTNENVSKTINQTDIDFPIDSDWDISKSTENQYAVDKKLLTNENESILNKSLNSCDSNFINFFDKSHSSPCSGTSSIKDNKPISPINRWRSNDGDYSCSEISPIDNKNSNFLMKNNAGNSQRIIDKEIYKTRQLIQNTDKSIEENVCMTFDYKEQESAKENRIKPIGQSPNINQSIDYDSSFNDDSILTNNDDILNKALILNCSSDTSMNALYQEQFMNHKPPEESFPDKISNIHEIDANLSFNEEKNKLDINQYNCASHRSIDVDLNISQLEIDNTIGDLSLCQNRFLNHKSLDESISNKSSNIEEIYVNLSYNKEEQKISDKIDISQQHIGAEDPNLSQLEIDSTINQSFSAIQEIPEQSEISKPTDYISQHLTDKQSTNWSMFNINDHSEGYSIINTDNSIDSIERIRDHKSNFISDFTFDFNNSIRNSFSANFSDKVSNTNTFCTPISLNFDRNCTSCANKRVQNEHIQMTPITYQIQSIKKPNSIVSQSKYYNLELLISSIKSQENKLDIDILYDKCFSIDNIHQFNQDLLTVNKKDWDSIIIDRNPPLQLCSYPEINQLYVTHIGNPILKVMEYCKTHLQTLCTKFIEKLERINKLKTNLLLKCFFCKRKQLCNHQNQLKVLTQDITDDMKANYNFLLRDVRWKYDFSLKSGTESFKMEVVKLNIKMRNIISERESKKQLFDNNMKLVMIDSKLKKAEMLVSSCLKMTEMDRVKQALMEKSHSKSPEQKKEDYLKFIISRKISPFREVHLTNSSIKFSLMGSRVNIIAKVRNESETIYIESATVTAELTLAPMNACIENYFQTLIDRYLFNRTTAYARNFLLNYQLPILLLFADVNLCRKYKYLAIYFESDNSFILKAQIMSNCPLARFSVVFDLNPISSYQHRSLKYQLEIDYNNVDDSKIRQIINNTGHGLNKLYRLFDKLFNELSSIVLTV